MLLFVGGRSTSATTKQPTIPRAHCSQDENTGTHQKEATAPF
jgi:hypothetical protein